MPDKLARSQFWIGLIVRAVCGALIGVFIGAGWVWYLSPDDSALIKWGGYIGIIVLCAVLAARYGDEFWTSMLRWLDY